MVGALKLAITLADCRKGDRGREVNARHINQGSRPTGALRLERSSRRPTGWTTPLRILSPLEIFLVMTVYMKIGCKSWRRPVDFGQAMVLG